MGRIKKDLKIGIDLGYVGWNHRFFMDPVPFPEESGLIVPAVDFHDKIRLGKHCHELKLSCRDDVQKTPAFAGDKEQKIDNNEIIEIKRKENENG